MLCYGAAAVRYFLRYRDQPSVMLISLVTAFTLLAAAMLAAALAPSWHTSWWLWHALMVFAFGFVAYSAFVQYQRDGGAAGLFDGIAAAHSERRIRGEYTDALETLVEAMAREDGSDGRRASLDTITAGVAARFNLGEGQARVLNRAAHSLVSERDQIRRLDVLVSLAARTTVRAGEPDLLAMIVRRLADGFARDVVRGGLLREGILEFPPALCTAPWPEAVAAGSTRKKPARPLSASA